MAGAVFSRDEIEEMNMEKDWIAKYLPAWKFLLAFVTVIATSTAFIVGGIHGIRDQIYLLKIELHGEIDSVRNDLRGSESRLGSRIDGEIDSVRNDLRGSESRLGSRIECLEKDVAIIKTVMLMKGIIPPELATNEKE